MIDAHKVVDYLKDHFNQSDVQIVLLLSQGALLMRDCHRVLMKTGFDDMAGFDAHLMHEIEGIAAYLDDAIEEEFL